MAVNGPDNDIFDGFDPFGFNPSESNLPVDDFDLDELDKEAEQAQAFTPAFGEATGSLKIPLQFLDSPKLDVAESSDEDEPLPHEKSSSLKNDDATLLSTFSPNKKRRNPNRY